MEELALADYLAILRRWKKVFLMTFLTLSGLSLAFALSWSTYRSTAVVQIEPAEISSAATLPLGANPSGTMEALADQRISQIQQKVEATASLIDIMAKFDLYAAARRSQPIALVADDMRKKIRVEWVGGAFANPAAGRASPQDLSAIAISFDAADPAVAQRVTGELVARFLDEDLKEKNAETQETDGFLSRQIAALEKSMSEQEAAIADYQKTHGDSRPDSLAFNRQAAALLILNLQNLDAQISANQAAIAALRAQLAGVDPYARVGADGHVLTTPTVELKALQAQYASLAAQYGPDHPDVIKARRQIEALQAQIGHSSAMTGQLQAQIADARAHLAEAEKTYGSEHPDVTTLKDRLQNLEDRLARQRPGGDATDGIIADADNPAYLQLVAELKTAQQQGRSLAEQRQQLQAQQENYRKAISDNPVGAQAMAALTRDYDNAQLRYRELKEKKMAADMGLQRQRDLKGARLTVIDPPDLPARTQPARIILFLGGLAVALIGGFGAVAVARLWGQNVVGIHHLESIAGTAPLVAIPHIYTHQEREGSMHNITRRKAHDIWGFIASRLSQWQGG